MHNSHPCGPADEERWESSPPEPMASPRRAAWVGWAYESVTLRHLRSSQRLVTRLQAEASTLDPRPSPTILKEYLQR
jgi:hypothetical protein